MAHTTDDGSGHGRGMDDYGPVPPTREELAKLYQPRVVSIARRITGSDDKAEELSQDFWRVAHRYDPSRAASFLTWAETCMHHRWIDQVRRLKRLPTTSLTDGLEDRLPSASTEPGDRHDGGALEWALVQLSNDHRDVIVLRHWRDMGYKEISAHLDIPEGTVSSRLERARLNLWRLIVAFELDESETGTSGGGREKST